MIAEREREAAAVKATGAMATKAAAAMMAVAAVAEDGGGGVGRVGEGGAVTQRWRGRRKWEKPGADGRRHLSNTEVNCGAS